MESIRTLSRLNSSRYALATIALSSFGAKVTNL